MRWVLIAARTENIVPRVATLYIIIIDPMLRVQMPVPRQHHC